MSSEGRTALQLDAEAEPVPAETQGRIAELYVRHSSSGIRLAYLLTGDRQLAEDLMQEAFAKLIGRLRHLRYPDAFDAYLRRTIVNLATSYFRHRAVERAYVEREGPRSDRPTIDPDVIAHEALRRAMLSLPERQRAALVLRFYEDLSEDEIAVILQCRPGTARSLVSRGMSGLRDELGGDADAR
jgi:RNA polymerase sigma-70 factor (sigma-E family)